MKSLVILPLAFLAIRAGAQEVNTSIGMSDELKQTAKMTNAQAGTESLQTYHTSVVNGTQFFANKWLKGSVLSVKNEKLSENYLFAFDKVRQQLFLKFKDSADVMVAKKDLIASFTLLSDRPHEFAPAEKYGLNKTGDFVEILVNDDKGYTLLKLVTTEFVKADPRDIEKQQKGDIYDAFVDNTTYYVIYNHSAPQEVTLKEWNIKKNLKAGKDKVSQYFDQQSNSEVDEAFLVGLVQYING
jgi:hypothetical protein